MAIAYRYSIGEQFAIATFFFDTKGAKKKVIKKETPGMISPPAGGDKGASRPLDLRQLFEKSWIKTFIAGFFLRKQKKGCRDATALFL